MGDHLTEERVIQEGGWHPEYTRVLLIQEIGDEAIALVDGNGDGAEVESEQWFLTDEGWVAGSSSGIGPLDDRPLWSWGWRSGSGYVVGCASPHQTVTVEWHGESREARANDLGVWAAVFPDHGPPQPAADTLRHAAATGIRRLSPEEWTELRSDRPRLVESG